MSNNTQMHSINAILNSSQAVKIPESEYNEYAYTFDNFFHPFVGELIESLNKGTFSNFFDPISLEKLEGDEKSNDFFSHFGDFYQNVNTNVAVKIKGFPKRIDLEAGGPYAVYNWEIFFHIPLSIAVHLSKNQRFAEAQRWFHYIFNPTSSDPAEPIPQRYWKFLAFRKAKATMRIDAQLTLLGKPDPELTESEREIKQSILNGYTAIGKKPFQPHAVARTRHLAYQYCVVMKYLDNLIAWGDSLFRQDTVESINEATQRYVFEPAGSTPPANPALWILKAQNILRT